MGMALVKFAAPCITAQFALLHVMCVRWRTELPSCLSGSGPNVMRSVSMVATSACLCVKSVRPRFVLQWWRIDAMIEPVEEFEVGV